MKIQEYTQKLKKAEGLQELENEPAFKRRNIELDESIPSKDNDMSRFSVSKNSDGGSSLNSNNSRITSYNVCYTKLLRPIVGLQRKLTLSNFALPFKIIKSMLKARKVLKQFKPQVVIGVGGYASGPTLKAATMQRIPSVIQEQNAFAGKTNKLLATKVNKICVVV